MSENFLLAFYPSNDNSNFWKKSSLSSKKVSSIKKLRIREVESFLKSNFDLTQKHQIGNFNATDLHHIFIKDLRNALKI